MQVLILTPDIYTRGGIARYSATLAGALATLIGPANVDVLPLLGIAGGREELPPCRVFNPIATRLSAAAKFRFAGKALRLGLRRYDLVIATHIGLSPVAGMLRALYRTPFWLVCHGSEAWGPFPADVRWAARRADLLLPVSRFTAEALALVNGVPESKMRVLYNAIPEDFARRLAAAGGGNGEAAAWGRGERRILSVGTVSQESAYKGYDTVIRALPEVLRAFPNARYVVVGKGDDIARLKRLARYTGVAERVEFAENVPDAELAALYRSCEVFALPSRTMPPNGKGWQGEGFGRVYVEAALAGKPVVGSTGGGAAEAVVHGKTGLLVQPESIAGVAGSLVRLLGDAELSTRMGREGQRWARRHFTVPALAGSLDALLAPYRSRVRPMTAGRRFLEELYRVWKHSDARTSLAYASRAMKSVPEIIRTRSLACVDEAMSGRRCRFRPFDGTMVDLDGSYFSGAREIYCRGVYFALPGFDIGREDVCVDLGANAGVFTTLAARRGKKVIAVEAQSEFLPLIRQNLLRNHCLDKASVELGLIGSTTGKLSDPGERKNCSHWGREAPVRSLPEVLGRHNVRRVDFLKVDIEGSEFGLLEGDCGWLDMVGRVAMEVHCQFGDANHLCARLQNHGFRVWLVDNHQTVVNRLNESSGYLFARRAG
ncbi:MAG TPA: FkbM family methyltransferase [Terriglobia bacterium]|nr:FkbM family methyltransferase [Terriglobia bacterium]